MMKKLCLVLCVAMVLSLCGFAVSAENTGPMDTFDDVFPRGDVDGSGKLEAKDYMKLKRAILGTYTLTSDEVTRADVSKDGKVDSKDYMMLKRVILGTYSF